MASTSDLPKVPRVKKGWYVLARSGEVRGSKPVRRALYGEPIALFRTASGQVGALQDRCPHRGVPLSFGTVRGDGLQCGYHGWEFSTAGRCTRVPGHLGDADTDKRCATRYVTREQQDFVWVWGDPDCDPIGDPHHFEFADDPDWLTVRYQTSTRGSLHMVAENALDVPHTAFLHAGLFRNDSNRNRIQAVIERHPDRAICEYIGEPRPPGIAARILSPSGGTVQHWDRFIMPCITAVEYRLGDENRIITSAALTPVDDYDTMVFACVRVKTRLPKRIIRPVLQPIAVRIFQQDAEILDLQVEALRRYGKLPYQHTDIDLLGPHILKLLNRAARGQTGDTKGPFRASVEMEI